MGTVERRLRERGQKHDAIVDAAVELFLSEGYQNTSIRKIAEKIEYTPGAIYSYFKDKDEILYEIHLRGFTELSETLSEALKETDPLDKLYRIGQLYIQFALENPEYYNSAAPFPVTWAQITTPGIYRNLQVIQLLVYPFRFSGE